jgi:hypothetical protein
LCLFGAAIAVGGFLVAGSGHAVATQEMQRPPAAIHFAADVQSAPTEMSAQRRLRRATTRIRVYRLPGSYPGPNAVRECRAWYVQEFRPSGTVIVPRMRCWWRR